MDEVFSTKKYFKAFVKEAKYWVKRFGITSWEVTVEASTDDEDAYLVDNRAVCLIQDDGRIVTILYNLEWDIEPNHYNVRKYAFHEVYHVLGFAVYPSCFNELSEYDKKQIRDGEHKIIRVMENTMFKDDYNRRFPQRRRK